MEYPLISVVMSTFNRAEHYLPLAIQSVLNQTYKNLELIIVSDASTDTTDSVVKKFKDKRIKYLKLRKNSGSDTYPKNKGILKSKGEYIAFLDDDNELYADALMMRYREIVKTGADVVYTDRLCIRDDEPDSTPQIGTNSDFNVEILFQQNFIDTSDVLIKRESLFFVGGWDQRFRKYVDWNLWIRMAKAGMKFFHIAKVASTYHLHTDMKSLRIKDQVTSTPFGNKSPEGIFRPQWNPQELEIQQEWLGELKNPTVAVFTLTHGRLEYLKQMYKGLQRAGYKFDWYVVDNTSNDGTVEWLVDKATVVIANAENKGISIGSNQALDAMKDNYDFIIKIDDDNIIYTENWLLEMLKMFQRNYTMALSPRVEGLVDNIGGSPRMGYGKIAGHTIGVTHHIGGIFTMAHKSSYKDWRWNEEDFLHGMQDLEYTQHLKKMGYICAYVEDMRCEHQTHLDYKEYFKNRSSEKTHKYEG
jgi:glycosyltransferase involved in cell wall biosynthesis